VIGKPHFGGGAYHRRSDPISMSALARAREGLGAAIDVVESCGLREEGTMIVLDGGRNSPAPPAGAQNTPTLDPVVGSFPQGGTRQPPANVPQPSGLFSGPGIRQTYSRNSTIRGGESHEGAMP
jgi:hypothetical protein